MLYSSILCQRQVLDIISKCVVVFFNQQMCNKVKSSLRFSHIIFLYKYVLYVLLVLFNFNFLSVDQHLENILFVFNVLAA